MTDVQVSKLSRRDLLEILLAVETDNNALQQELTELREQLQQLKQDQERNDSGLADALSTALFLLPQDRGQELLDHFGAEAMWVDREGGIFYSPGFQDMIRT